jgi:hypothetical protein
LMQPVSFSIRYYNEEMRWTQSEFQSSASAISASLRLRGIETRLTRIKKNPGLAERSNAEKWVQYLSSFDVSAGTCSTVWSTPIDSLKCSAISRCQSTPVPSSGPVERTSYAKPHVCACIRGAADSLYPDRDSRL